MHWSEVTDWDRVCDALAAAEPQWKPGTAQGCHMVAFGFILGEMVRRVTGRTLGQYLRSEIAGADGHPTSHRAAADQHSRCAEMMSSRTSATCWPTAAPLVSGVARRASDGRAVHRDGFVPDDELGSKRTGHLALRRIPGHQRPCFALAWQYPNGWPWSWPAGAPRPRSARVSQGGFDPDVVLGPRVANHGWGLGYMLNQRPVAGPNVRSFGHPGAPGGSYGFVDLEHGIGYAYVSELLRRYQRRRPRTTAASDEVLPGAQERCKPGLSVPPANGGVGTVVAMNSVVLLLLILVIGGVALTMFQFLARVGQPAGGQPG